MIPVCDFRGELLDGIPGHVNLTPQPFLQRTKRQRHVAARHITDENNVDVAFRPLAAFRDRTVNEGQGNLSGKWGQCFSQRIGNPGCLGQNAREFCKNRTRRIDAVINTISICVTVKYACT